MSAFRDTVVRITSFVVTAAAVIACIVLFALMLLTTADVIGRYFFNHPLTGVFDFTHFAVLIMTFFSFAYCGFHGSHVTIELLYRLFGPRTREIIKRGASLAGCILFATIAWQSIAASADVRMFKFASQLMLIPFWPFYYVIAFGAALFAFVLLLYVFIPEPEAHEPQ